MYAFNKFKKKNERRSSFSQVVQHLTCFCAACVRLEPALYVKMSVCASKLVLQSLFFPSKPGQEGWDFSQNSGLCRPFVSLD